jgi:ketosteroid isomerase-like protein
MSQENVEIVRRFFEAFLDGPEGLKRAFTRTSSTSKIRSGLALTPIRGRDAVVECWFQYDELMGKAASFSVLDIRDADDEVIALVRVSGRTRESELPYEQTWGYRCRTEADRVSYFAHISTHLRPSKPPGCRSRPLAMGRGGFEPPTYGL